MTELKTPDAQSLIGAAQASFRKALISNVRKDMGVSVSPSERLTGEPLREALRAYMDWRNEVIRSMGLAEGETVPVEPEMVQRMASDLFADADEVDAIVNPKS